MAGRCGTVAWFLSVWEIDFTNTKDTLAKKELRYRLDGTTYFLLYLARHTISPPYDTIRKLSHQHFFSGFKHTLYYTPYRSVLYQVERFRKSYHRDRKVPLWGHIFRNSGILDTFYSVTTWRLTVRCNCPYTDISLFDEHRRNVY